MTGMTDAGLLQLRLDLETAIREQLAPARDFLAVAS